MGAVNTHTVTFAYQWEPGERRDNWGVVEPILCPKCGTQMEQATVWASPVAYRTEAPTRCPQCDAIAVCLADDAGCTARIPEPQNEVVHIDSEGCVTFEE